MTQDATPADEDLIANLVAAFDDPDVVVSYARHLPYSDADPIERFARHTNYPPISRVQSKGTLPELGIKGFFCSNSCAMYRGEYFRASGGFKRDNNTSEDMEFAARAIVEGKKVAYAADAKVYHSHRFSLLQTWKRYREIGVFFADNRWILETVSQYKRTESTGVGQAIRELRYLVRHAPLWVPRSIVVSVVKYVAFKTAFYNN
jgi:rhamnosyltransferase